MTLLRRGPYDLFYDMDRTMDRMRSLLDWGAGPELNANTLAIDMSSDEQNLIIRTALPGFKENEVNIDVRGNVLTISAETQTERDDQQANWHIREMRYGKFSRSVMLPEDVSTDKADASLADGILTVKLPKQKTSVVHRIAVKARNLLKAGDKPENGS